MRCLWRRLTAVTRHHWGVGRTRNAWRDLGVWGALCCRMPQESCVSLAARAALRCSPPPTTVRLGSWPSPEGWLLYSVLWLCGAGTRRTAGRPCRGGTIRGSALSGPVLHLTLAHPAAPTTSGPEARHEGTIVAVAPTEGADGEFNEEDDCYPVDVVDEGDSASISSKPKVSGRLGSSERPSGVCSTKAPLVDRRVT